MEMKPVQSSQIASIGHDGQSKLRVQFRSGGLYEYSDVTPEEFTKLSTAPSIGGHLAKHIKPAKSFTKVESE